MGIATLHPVLHDLPRLAPILERCIDLEPGDKAHDQDSIQRPDRFHGRGRGVAADDKDVYQGDEYNQQAEYAVYSQPQLVSKPQVLAPDGRSDEQKQEDHREPGGPSG